MWSSWILGTCRVIGCGVLIGGGLVATADQQPQLPRARMWVDALRGEPIDFEEMLDDLRQVRVVYLGEYHTIPRHHQLEKDLLQALAKRGLRLVLAMEQFEFFTQPALDRFNGGGLDVEGLVKETNLGKRWPGYTNYTGLLAAARDLNVPVLALNARAETIRAIGRRGLAGLGLEQRSELPGTLSTNDPPYERLLNQTLAVHMAFDPAKLRPVFEAQVARDETMAERLTSFLGSAAGRDRVALVICGQGHCEFGLGTPERVARRGADISQRILLFSQSGDLQLTSQERQQARDIEISHAFLREMGRAPADYFQITEPTGP
jgi:uncharacterized iron-regulated protein